MGTTATAFHLDVVVGQCQFDISTTNSTTTTNTNSTTITITTTITIRTNHCGVTNVHNYCSIIPLLWYNTNHDIQLPFIVTCTVPYPHNIIIIYTYDRYCTTKYIYI